MVHEELEPKHDEDVRFVTFNVNGLRTLFNYHPFSAMERSLSRVFDYFKSDIITFQELKTDKHSLTKWGKVDGFYSFISLPKTKKGYSGVGCWVRIPRADDPMFGKLTVVKAEEGITGWLKVKIGNEMIRYKDDESQGIGGYESLGIQNESEAMDLDSEGRCVMVELACNLVVICTYCPANSSLTDEGEVFRLKYLKVLFRRIRNLHLMGKEVVLMGDINVCRDLIDHAESLEKAQISLNNFKSGIEIEKQNVQKVKEFIYNPSRPARRILNENLADSVLQDLSEHGELVDTTRVLQGRSRLKMYTVWNTLKNSRPINYGSRIDFILVSSRMKSEVRQANIWPQIMGSDHCPVFADLRLNKSAVIASGLLPRFEARYKYNLNQGDILSMFSKSMKKNPPLSQPSPKSKVTKKSMKQPRDIQTALMSNPELEGHLHNDAQKTSRREDRKSKVLNTKGYGESSNEIIKKMFGKPPLCKHGEEAILRTSKTNHNPGKRFWICNRPKGEAKDKSSSCDFFQWK